MKLSFREWRRRYGRNPQYRFVRNYFLAKASITSIPEILVLDEPLSGLDISSAALFHHILQALARRGKTILYISHLLEVVEKTCSRMIILHEGRVRAEGRVDDLRALTERASLSSVISDLVQLEDPERAAGEIVEVVSQ